MLAALGAYQRGFAGRKARIFYALKANSSLAVLQVFARAGCGFDIVSGGELERVLAAAQRPATSSSRASARPGARCVARWRWASCFNVESEARARGAEPSRRGLGGQAPVSLRVNPDVDPKPYPYISA